MAAGDISYRHAALIATATAEPPAADTGSAESTLLQARRGPADPGGLGRAAPGAGRARQGLSLPRPPAWTDAHHRRPWADGGPTNLANLILLCPAHHRCVHQDGWRLEGDPNGVITAVRPDGVEIRPP